MTTSHCGHHAGVLEKLKELNEAFACQVVYCRDELGIDNARLNVNGGSISIDGQDIAHLGLSQLRKAIAMLPQDPTLFTGSIRSVRRSLLRPCWICAVPLTAVGRCPQNIDPFEQYTDAHSGASAHNAVHTHPARHRWHHHRGWQHGVPAVWEAAKTTTWSLPVMWAGARARRMRNEKWGTQRNATWTKFPTTTVSGRQGHRLYPNPCREGPSWPCLTLRGTVPWFVGNSVAARTCRRTKGHCFDLFFFTIGQDNSAVL